MLSPDELLGWDCALNGRALRGASSSRFRCAGQTLAANGMLAGILAPQDFLKNAAGRDRTVATSLLFPIWSVGGGGFTEFRPQLSEEEG